MASLSEPSDDLTDVEEKFLQALPPSLRPAYLRVVPIARESLACVLRDAKESFVRQMKFLSGCGVLVSSAAHHDFDAPAPALHTVLGVNDAIDVNTTTDSIRHKWTSVKEWWRTFKATREDPVDDRGRVTREKTLVRPVNKAILMAAASGTLWRYHPHGPVVDHIDNTRAQLDHCLTTTYVLCPAMTSALVMVQDALPGSVHAAARDALGHSRRRVLMLFTIADAGDATPAQLRALSSLVVGSDVRHVRFVRTHLGGPRDDDTFLRCDPYSWQETADMPVWPAFTTDAGCPDPPAEPLPGFIALCRLFERGPCDYDIFNVVGSVLAAPEPFAVVDGGGSRTLTFTRLMGTGGSSHVHQTTDNRVVKILHAVTPHAASALSWEAAVISAINDGASTTPPESRHVPHGARLVPVDPPRCSSHGLAHSRSHSSESVLIMDGPVGSSVAARVRDLSVQQKAEEADRMVQDVSVALDGALRAGYVHTDVRPPNIVWADGYGYVLVDWGIALPRGSACYRHGTPSFAADGVFPWSTTLRHDSERECAARWMDDASLLYSWLSVVHGDAVSTPWIADDGWVEEARHNWLEANRDKLGVACIASLLTAVYRRPPSRIRWEAFSAIRAGVADADAVTEANDDADDSDGDDGVDGDDAQDDTTASDVVVGVGAAAGCV